MTEKFIINQNGEIEDTMGHITFDSFMEILIVLNGQSRHLKKLSEENEKLKLKVNGLKSELSIWKEDANEHIQEINKLFEENKQLKQQNEQAIDLILNGIMEMHDGKRDYAEKLLNEAIELIK